MKRSIIRLALYAMVIVSASACSKETTRINGGNEIPVMVSCSIDAVAVSQTKTHISGIENDMASIAWDAEDDISVFSTNVSSHLNNKFTISNISGGSARFTGEVEEQTSDFVALYPYSASLSYSDGIISNALIPAVQAASDNSFAAGSSLAMATGTRTPGDPSSTSALSFVNLCSSISFYLPGNIDASSVVVTSKSGANLAGSVRIDTANPAISSPSAPSITLDGPFHGGNTYYVTIAPGQYDGGFRFVISTTAGNSYTLETTMDVAAQAGRIYHLGNLTLKLADADFTTSMFITHNVSGSVLNGSDAKFTLNVNKPEFAATVSEYSYTVTVRNSSNTIYCQATKTSTSAPTNVTIDAVSSLPYMPKGTYTYTVSLDYKVSNGTKDVTRHIDLPARNVTSPQPSGFAIDADVNGYTSYSCYKGTDGQTASTSNANNCDPATIYGVGASYRSGLSSAVYSQCSSLLSFTSYLDGTAVSEGDQGGQSLTSHTISASWSFDGASGDCPTSKTVSVTGLPYNRSAALMEAVFNDGWAYGDDAADSGAHKFEDGHLFLRPRNGGIKRSSVTFKGFNVPADINVSVGYKVGLYCAVATSPQHLVLKVGSTSLEDWTLRATAKWEYRTLIESDAALTPSDNTIKQSIEGNSSSWVTGQSKFQWIRVSYR